MGTVSVALHRLLQKCAVLFIFLHCTYMKGSSGGADIGLPPILNNGWYHHLYSSLVEPVYVLFYWLLEPKEIQFGASSGSMALVCLAQEEAGAVSDRPSGSLE